MAQVAAVGSLTDKFTGMVFDKIMEDVWLVTTFGEQFQSLCDELITIKDVFMDAAAFKDGRDEMISTSTSNWLNKVEEFLADAEYIVEECAAVTNCQFRNPFFRYWMGRKIKGLNDRIRNITWGSKHFKNFESVLALNARFQTSNKLEDNETSSSSFTEQNPLGMQKDINEITDIILQDDGPQRIAIVGEGGSGKTLLLHHVFRNSRVLEAGFAHRIWLPITQKFEYHSLLVEICIHVKPSILKSGNTLPENWLKQKIEENLQGKRCLFAMDDVWSKLNLERIGLNFPSQTKVVITTRNQNLVADYKIHKMGPLSKEDGWTLFCSHAFPQKHTRPEEVRQHTPPEELRDVAIHIQERCCGLPLALKMVGHHMASVSSKIEDWESTLKHLEAEHLQANPMIGIEKSLRLSYQDLPYYLKLCFVYFSAFPKNTEIETEYLVYAWISEGFISSRADAYNAGLSYINQLINRCLIEASEFSWDGRVKLCKIHDLLHELAHSTKHPTWWLEPAGEMKELTNECLNLSRSSLSKNNISKISVIKNNISIIEEAVNCPRLRTLLLSDNGNLESISAKFFHNLGYLNVLDLSSTSIRSLPRSIGRLKHLKFLNLSSTKIEKLPKSLSNLRALIFMDVSNCKSLKRLHQGIGKHKFMLHLNVESTDLELFPVGISQLVYLETLKGVKFNSENAANVNPLQLSHLKGLISLEQALQLSDLKGLTRLEHLSINIDADPPFGTFVGMQNMRILSCRNSRLEKKLIQLPELPGDMHVMKRLQIVRLYKCAVPEWMSRLQTLLELQLQGHGDTPKIDYKGVENIPNLRKLHLSLFTSFPDCFGQAKAFPKLEELFLDLSDFDGFPSLDDDAMPKLKRLRLQNCSYSRDGPNWQFFKNHKVRVTSLSCDERESKNVREVPIEEVTTLSGDERESKNVKEIPTHFDSNVEVTGTGTDHVYKEVSTSEQGIDSNEEVAGTDHIYNGDSTSEQVSDSNGEVTGTDRVYNGDPSSEQGLHSNGELTGTDHVYMEVPNSHKKVKEIPIEGVTSLSRDERELMRKRVDSKNAKGVQTHFDSNEGVTSMSGDERESKNAKEFQTHFDSKERVTSLSGDERESKNVKEIPTHFDSNVEVTGTDHVYKEVSTSEQGIDSNGEVARTDHIYNGDPTSKQVPNSNGEVTDHIYNGESASEQVSDSNGEVAGTDRVYNGDPTSENGLDSNGELTGTDHVYMKVPTSKQGLASYGEVSDTDQVDYEVRISE